MSTRNFKKSKIFSWPFVPLVFGLVCPGNSEARGDAQDSLGEACTTATHQRDAYMKSYFLGAMPYAAGCLYDV